MPPRRWPLRVRDILDSITAIQDYTRDMDFSAFAADPRTVDAVVRRFAIIGEAANNIPAEIVAAYPEIPWRDMREMRNVLVHVYFGINKRILWEAIHNDLPPLVPILTRLLDENPP